METIPLVLYLLLTQEDTSKGMQWKVSGGYISMNACQEAGAAVPLVKLGKGA
jgi:hypothetical protein